MLRDLKLMRRALALLAALGLAILPASAQMPPNKRAAIYSGVGSVVYSSVMNFVSGTYSGPCATISSCISATRSGSATDLTFNAAPGSSYATYSANTLRIKAGWGLLAENTRINYLLLSTIPATQTTGTLPTGFFTLWVNGTGSATVSGGTATGCGTGVATQYNPAVGQITVGGTCIVTVSGGLNEFQLEFGPQAFSSPVVNGTDPTSFIVTTSSPAARSAETIQAIGPFATALASSSGFVVEGLNGVIAGNSVQLDRNSNVDYFLNSVSTGYQVRAQTHNITTLQPPPLFSFSYSTNTQTRLATTWAPGKTCGAWNEGAPNCQNFGFSGPSPNLVFGFVTNTGMVDTFITSASYGTSLLAPQLLVSATKGWSLSFSRFIGDSLTFGYESSLSYPIQLIAQLPGLLMQLPYVKLGIVGGTAQGLVANYGTEIAPYYDASIPKCVDFIWAGRNDLTNGTTPAQTLVYIEELWASSKAKGCKVVAMTILPIASITEVNRQALNTLIRNASSLYDALSDVGNDPLIGQAGDYTNTMYYYTDQIHLIAAGDAIVAADTAAVLSGILP